MLITLGLDSEVRNVESNFATRAKNFSEKQALGWHYTVHEKVYTKSWKEIITYFSKLRGHLLGTQFIAYTLYTNVGYVRDKNSLITD